MNAPDRHDGGDYVRFHCPVDALQVLRRRTTTVRADGRCDDPDMFPAERRVTDVARSTHPVDPILRRAGDRPVVCGRRREHPVRCDNGGSQFADQWRRVGVQVFVVMRDLSNLVVSVERPAEPHELSFGDAQQRRVERPASQAAAHCHEVEGLHGCDSAARRRHPC